MAKKPTARSEFVLFDVVYEDGSPRSNRKVSAEILGGLDGDEPARAESEAPDKAIAEKSRMPPAAPGSLSKSTYANIIAYILEVNGLKPGAAALPAGGDGLNKTAIR